MWPTWYLTFRHLAMKRWTCSKHGAKAEHKCNVQAHKCKVEELMQRLSPPRLASPPHTGQTPWEPVSGSSSPHTGQTPWEPVSGPSPPHVGQTPWEPVSGLSPPHTGLTPWEPVSGPSPGMRGPEQEGHCPQAGHSRQRHQRRNNRHRLDRDRDPSSTQDPSLPQAPPPSLLRSQTESHTKQCQVLDFFLHMMPCSH